MHNIWFKLQSLISKKLGIDIQTDMTARDFLCLIPKEYNTVELENITKIYEKAYYGKKATSEDVNKFISNLKKNLEVGA